MNSSGVVDHHLAEAGGNGNAATGIGIETEVGTGIGIVIAIEVEIVIETEIGIENILVLVATIDLVLIHGAPLGSVKIVKAGLHHAAGAVVEAIHVAVVARERGVGVGVEVGVEVHLRPPSVLTAVPSAHSLTLKQNIITLWNSLECSDR